MNMEGMQTIEIAYQWVYHVSLVILAIFLLLCLVRAIIGPRISDRLMAGNMMGTIVMVMVSILALMLNEGYLEDICLIYALISFLAVVVITKVYIGVLAEKAENEEEGKKNA